MELEIHCTQLRIQFLPYVPVIMEIPEYLLAGIVLLDRCNGIQYRAALRNIRVIADETDKLCPVLPYRIGTEKGDCFPVIRTLYQIRLELFCTLSGQLHVQIV